MGYTLQNFQIKALTKAFKQAGYSIGKINASIQYIQNNIHSDKEYSIKLKVIEEYQCERNFILLSRNREEKFTCNFNNGHTLNRINLQVTPNICNADIIFPDNKVIVDFKHTKNMWKQASSNYGWSSNSGFIINSNHVNKYYQQGKQLNMTPWLAVLIEDPDTARELIFVNINEAMDIFNASQGDNDKIRIVDVYTNTNYVFNKCNWYKQNYFWDYLRKNQK